MAAVPGMSCWPERSIRQAPQSAAHDWLGAQEVPLALRLVRGFGDGGGEFGDSGGGFGGSGGGFDVAGGVCSPAALALPAFSLCSAGGDGVWERIN